MAKELSEETREIFETHGKVMVWTAQVKDAPLWQVREALIAAFDAEAERTGNADTEAA